MRRDNKFGNGLLQSGRGGRNSKKAHRNDDQFGYRCERQHRAHGERENDNDRFDIIASLERVIPAVEQLRYVAPDRNKQHGYGNEFDSAGSQATILYRPACRIHVQALCLAMA